MIETDNNRDPKMDYVHYSSPFSPFAHMHEENKGYWMMMMMMCSLCWVENKMQKGHQTQTGHDSETLLKKMQVEENLQNIRRTKSIWQNRDDKLHFQGHNNPRLTKINNDPG